MNYGKWSGKYLKDSRKESSWKVIQKRPSQFTFPQGESFASAARRVERQLNKIAQKFPNKRILVVTHGDVIKLAAAKALNMEIDDFQRIIIDPCSLTVIDWNKSQRTLMQLNLPTSQSRVRRISSLKNRRVIGGGSGV
jgi:probable phosphoglycerate mutase